MFNTYSQITDIQGFECKNLNFKLCFSDLPKLNHRTCAFYPHRYAAISVCRMLAGRYPQSGHYALGRNQ